MPRIAKGDSGLQELRHLPRHFKHAAGRLWTKVLIRLMSVEFVRRAMPYCGPIPVVKNGPFGRQRPNLTQRIMSFLGVRNLAVLLCAAFLAGTVVSAQAQGSNPDQRPPEQKAQAPSGDAAKAEAEKKRSDEIAEASRQLTGPAANPECIWLGWRVVRLLWRDDLDTAFRHLDLYDRFGCPGNHIQASFRCLVRQGPADSKAAEALDKAVKACWVNPALAPEPAAAAAPSNQPAQGGTSTR
jgi:hypothetical protein